MSSGAGPGRFDEGKRVPMDVKVGDKVLYGKYSGTEVTIDGDTVTLAGPAVRIADIEISDVGVRA